jgi:hypothetical protein
MTSHTCGLALVILLVSADDAWAYIDPGTGSYLFQLAAAGFLAGAYTLRKYWHSVKAVVRGRFGRSRSSEHTPTDGD